MPRQRLRDVMPPEVPETFGKPFISTEPSARAPAQMEETQGEPAYMVIHLQKITKKHYDEKKRDKQFVTSTRTSPVGFTWEKDKDRFAYVTQDSEYFMGELFSDYTNEMFASRSTSGVDFGMPKITLIKE